MKYRRPAPAGNLTVAGPPGVMMSLTKPPEALPTMASYLMNSCVDWFAGIACTIVELTMFVGTMSPLSSTATKDSGRMPGSTFT